MVAGLSIPAKTKPPKMKRRGFPRAEARSIARGLHSLPDFLTVPPASSLGASRSRQSLRRTLLDSAALIRDRPSGVDMASTMPRRTGAAKTKPPGRLGIVRGLCFPAPGV